MPFIEKVDQQIIEGISRTKGTDRERYQPAFINKVAITIATLFTQTGNA